MTAVDDVADADVIVLNTCCIRENADNKLYGHLGHLKSLKDQRPDLQIAVAGCLAQKDRDTIRERAPHVDVVFGTHNVHRAADLLTEAREHGPITEILEATVADDAQAFPSALPARRDTEHSAWVTIQIGCDNTCAFCIVPAVRGPGDQPAVRRHRRRGRHLGRPGRHRGHAARPERQQLRPGPDEAPAAVRRPAPGGRRGRRHPAGPVHQPAPEGPAAGDHRRHGRGADGVRAPPPPAPVGQRPGPRRHAPRLHGRALPDEAGRRPRRRARPGGDHRHHRRLPRRDRRRLRAHPRGGRRRRVRQRLHVHLLAPAGHRGGRAGRRLRRAGRRGRALRAPAGRHRASGAAKHTGPGRRHRGGRRRGPDPAGPDADQRPHPPEQARPLRRRPTRCDPARWPRSRSPAPAPTTSGATSCASPPRPATAPASRWSRAEPTSPSSGRRRRGSRRWPTSWPGPPGTWRSVRSTRCRSTGGWTSARRSRPPPSRPRCRTTSSTWPIPTTTSRWPSSRRPWPTRSPASRSGGTGRCWSGAPPSTCGRWSTA